MKWFVNGLQRIAQLAAIATVLAACGTDAGTDASRPDANNQTDAAITDRSAPQPDVVVTPDTPLPPPPPDVPATPDAPPPPLDGPTEDASVPPPDKPSMKSMDQVGETFNQFNWRVRGTSACDAIIYESNSVRIGGELRLALNARYSTGPCMTRTMSCVLPSEGTPDALVLRGLRPGMTELEAVMNGSTNILEAVTGNCR